jgi:AbrB family looped-hinge helix DNA binding protein
MQSDIPTVKEEAMAELVLAKVSQKGQMTIPQELRTAAGIAAGDYVALWPLMDGIFVSKASIAPRVKAEDVLRRLVVHIGQEAGARGIEEDEDLDPIIEDIQRRVYQETYGR